MATTLTGAEQVEWNLSDLFEGPDDPRIDSELEEALEAAQAFRERYRGKLGSCRRGAARRGRRGSSGSRAISYRVEVFARLRFAADNSDQARGALVQKVRERNTQVETELLFFDLEWAALDDDVAERLLADPALEHYATVLRSERRYRPFQLSEPEERISAEKSLTGVGAWDRFFNELLSELRVSLDGEDLSLDEALAKLSRADLPGGARPRRGGGHRGAAAGPAHARLRVQHDPQRAGDRGPAARLLDLDLGAEPRQRDPRRGCRQPGRRDRRALRHPAPLLRAQGEAARPAAAARLRPVRAAAGGGRDDRVGRRARPRARRLQRLLAGGGRDRRPLLRARLDRRRGAAGEDPRRLLRDASSRTSTRTC